MMSKINECLFNFVYLYICIFDIFIVENRLFGGKCGPQFKVFEICFSGLPRKKGLHIDTQS